MSNRPRIRASLYRTLCRRFVVARHGESWQVLDRGYGGRLFARRPDAVTARRCAIAEAYAVAVGCPHPDDVWFVVERTDTGRRAEARPLPALRSLLAEALAFAAVAE